MKKIGVCLLLQVFNILGINNVGNNDNNYTYDDDEDQDEYNNTEEVKYYNNNENNNLEDITDITNKEKKTDIYDIITSSDVEENQNGLLVHKNPNINNNNNETTIMDDGNFYAIFIIEHIESITNINSSILRQKKLEELKNQLESLGTVDVFFYFLFYIMKYPNNIILDNKNKKIIINNNMFILEFKDKFIQCFIEEKKFIILFTEDKYKCLMTFLNIEGEIYSELKTFFTYIKLENYIEKQMIKPPINISTNKPNESLNIKNTTTNIKNSSNKKYQKDNTKTKNKKTNIKNKKTNIKNLPNKKHQKKDNTKTKNKKTNIKNSSNIKNQKKR